MSLHIIFPEALYGGGLSKIEQIIQFILIHTWYLNHVKRTLGHMYHTFNVSESDTYVAHFAELLVTGICWGLSVMAFMPQESKKKLTI